MADLWVVEKAGKMALWMVEQRVKSMDIVMDEQWAGTMDGA